MQLVEREPALASLASGLAAAVDGHGRVALVQGEAGIGKSALAASFAARHRDVADVLWGACDALFTPRPLGPLGDMAAQMRGELLAALDANRDRSHIFSLFLRALREAKRPTIAVFEDLHWADEATLDLIKFLARRIQNVRVLLLLTYRDDELHARHPLRSLLGELPREQTLRNALAPLSHESVTLLAEKAGRAGEAARLYATTEGNPFYVTEVLAAEAAGVPATVRDAVLARAARLSVIGRAVLDVISLSPGGTEAGVLEACVAEAAAGLDECMTRGMLRLRDGTYSFRHELARVAVSEDLGPLRRRDLHRSVLHALRSRTSQAESLAQLAHHAAAAEDPDAVLEYAPEAARRAANLGAHREAAAHYALAVRHADRLSLRERASLLAAHADESYTTGDVATGIAARERAGEIWRELNEPVLEADNLCRMMGFYVSAGRDQDAERATRTAIDLLEPRGASRQLAFAYRTQAAMRMLQRDHAEAIAWGEKAAALAEQLGDSSTSISANNAIGCSLILTGEVERGCESLEKALALALQAGLEHQAIVAYANLGSTCGEILSIRFSGSLPRGGYRVCNRARLRSWPAVHDVVAQPVAASPGTVGCGRGNGNRGAQCIGRCVHQPYRGAGGAGTIARASRRSRRHGCSRPGARARRALRQPAETCAGSCGAGRSRLARRRYGINVGGVAGDVLAGPRKITPMVRR
jgi:tetratricopeptide (TPR) repeat protein